MSLYTDLIKRVLIGSIYQDPPMDPWSKGQPYSELKRRTGQDWPSQSHTMVGLERLNNIERLLGWVLDNVEGDLCETGVWRGGCCIFMQAILKERSNGDTPSRLIFACDSYEGLPPPDLFRYPQDAGDQHSTFEQLKVSSDEVEANFRRYNLWDENVWLVKGFFHDTLPAMIERFNPRLALLRLDGDMYGSTMDALVNLYPRLNEYGYVIVDDYGILPQCRQAVDDYLKQNNIEVTIRPIDHSGVYFQKPRDNGASSEADRPSVPKVET